MNNGEEKENKRTMLEWIFAIKRKHDDIKERSLLLCSKNNAILTIILAVMAVLIIDYVVSRNYSAIIYGIIIAALAAVAIGIFFNALCKIDEWLDFNRKIMSVKNMVIIILLLALPVHFFIQSATVYLRTDWERL